jgi:hypothetical protein
MLGMGGELNRMGIPGFTMQYDHTYAMAARYKILNGPPLKAQQVTKEP